MRRPVRRPALVALALLLASGLTACSGDDAPAARPGLSPGATTAASAPPATAEASSTAQASDEQARLARSYPVSLRPTVESVYDHVQPLLDAFDAFDRPRPETAQVRDDVFAAGGARGALVARRRELAAAPSPDAFAPRVKELDTALAGLVQAAGLLAQATRTAPGPGGAVPGYRAGEQRLDAAVNAWAKAVTLTYGGTQVPLTPRRHRTGVRAPSSKGAWLLSAGQTCGRTGVARVAAAELAPLALPKVDAARLRAKVLAPLAQVRAGKGRPALAAAANGLAEYGSSVCAGLFAVREG